MVAKSHVKIPQRKNLYSYGSSIIDVWEQKITGPFGIPGKVYTIGGGNILDDRDPSIVNICEMETVKPCYQIRWDSDLNLKDSDIINFIRRFYQDCVNVVGDNCKPYVEGIPGIKSSSFCILFNTHGLKKNLPLERFFERDFEMEVELSQPDLIRLNTPYFHFAYVFNTEVATPHMLDRLAIESHLDLSEHLAPLIEKTHRTTMEDLVAKGMFIAIKDILSKYGPRK